MRCPEPNHTADMVEKQIVTIGDNQYLVIKCPLCAYEVLVPYSPWEPYKKGVWPWNKELQDEYGQD